MMLAQVLWTDVLSTQSTRDPEVVNGIRESMSIQMTGDRSCNGLPHYIREL